MACGQPTRHAAIEDQRDLQSAAVLPTLVSPTAKPINFEPMTCLIFTHRTRRNLGEVRWNLAKISDGRTPESEH